MNSLLGMLGCWCCVLIVSCFCFAARVSIYRQELPSRCLPARVSSIIHLFFLNGHHAPMLQTLQALQPLQASFVASQLHDSMLEGIVCAASTLPWMIWLLLYLHNGHLVLHHDCVLDNYFSKQKHVAMSSRLFGLFMLACTEPKELMHLAACILMLILLLLLFIITFFFTSFFGYRSSTPE